MMVMMVQMQKLDLWHDLDLGLDLGLLREPLIR